MAPARDIPRSDPNDRPRLTATIRPIPTLDETARLSRTLAFPPPEMTFLHSSLRLDLPPPSFSSFPSNSPFPSNSSFPSNSPFPSDSGSGSGSGSAHGRWIEWNVLDALRAVELRHPSIEVQHALTWQSAKGSKEMEGLEEAEVFDWTYSTTYPGSPSSSISFRPARPDHPGLPKALLGDLRMPILKYESVRLFEDELGDHGSVSLEVQARQTEGYTFVRSAFLLRIDGVLFRSFYVRLFLAHDRPREVIRECTGRQAAWGDVLALLGSDPVHWTDWGQVDRALVQLDSTPHHSGPDRPPRTVSHAATAIPPERPAIVAGEGQNILPPLVRVRPRKTPAAQSVMPQADASMRSPASGERDGPKGSVRSEVGGPKKDALPPWQGLGTRLEIADLS